MANTAQARKRARQTEKRRQHNASLRSEMRSAIKNVRKAIIAGDKTAAQNVFVKAQAAIDSITRKGLFHPNAASRYKSRLSSAVKAMA
ncbi:MAG: 30S ribosomal protein S20 [Betaproteobacteria bacterium]|nr:30S ribosomal protein S20 [Betaproteobacteria bacterium]MBL8535296.1 30S ribosomal protein S20 [Betaproteobacteria bacterium]